MAVQLEEDKQRKQYDEIIRETLLSSLGKMTDLDYLSLSARKSAGGNSS